MLRNISRPMCTNELRSRRTVTFRIPVWNKISVPRLRNSINKKTVNKWLPRLTRPVRVEAKRHYWPCTTDTGHPPSVRPAAGTTDTIMGPCAPPNTRRWYTSRGRIPAAAVTGRGYRVSTAAGRTVAITFQFGSARTRPFLVPVCQTFVSCKINSQSACTFTRSSVSNDEITQTIEYILEK